jgi:hypothetical protein
MHGCWTWAAAMVNSLTTSPPAKNWPWTSTRSFPSISRRRSNTSSRTAPRRGEHLTDKASLSRTLAHALRTLKPGGRLIAVGPNIKYLHGQYWDFYDHHVYLTETSLGEAMEISGYHIDWIVPKFLPFTMVKAPEYPLFFVRLYIAFPWIWKILGKQFLLVAHKPKP